MCSIKSQNDRRSPPIQQLCLGNKRAENVTLHNEIIASSNSVHKIRTARSIFSEGSLITVSWRCLESSFAFKLKFHWTAIFFFFHERTQVLSCHKNGNGRKKWRKKCKRAVTSSLCVACQSFLQFFRLRSFCCLAREEPFHCFADMVKGNQPWQLYPFCADHHVIWSLWWLSLIDRWGFTSSLQCDSRTHDNFLMWQSQSQANSGSQPPVKPNRTNQKRKEIEGVLSTKKLYFPCSAGIAQSFIFTTTSFLFRCYDFAAHIDVFATWTRECFYCEKKKRDRSELGQKHLSSCFLSRHPLTVPNLKFDDREKKLDDRENMWPKNPQHWSQM